MSIINLFYFGCHFWIIPLLNGSRKIRRCAATQLRLFPHQLSICDLDSFCCCCCYSWFPFHLVHNLINSCSNSICWSVFFLLLNLAFFSFSFMLCQIRSCPISNWNARIFTTFHNKFSASLLFSLWLLALPYQCHGVAYTLMWMQFQCQWRMHVPM